MKLCWPTVKRMSIFHAVSSALHLPNLAQYRSSSPDTQLGQNQIRTQRLDWHDALDEQRLPGLHLLLQYDINPDVIVGADIVRTVLELLRYVLTFD